MYLRATPYIGAHPPNPKMSTSATETRELDDLEERVAARHIAVCTEPNRAGRIPAVFFFPGKDGWGTEVKTDLLAVPAIGNSVSFDGLGADCPDALRDGYLRVEQVHHTVGADCHAVWIRVSRDPADGDA